MWGKRAFLQSLPNKASPKLDVRDVNTPVHRGPSSPTNLGTPTVYCLHEEQTEKGCYVFIKIRGRQFKVLVDTGSSVSILKLPTLEKRDTRRIKSADHVKLISVTGHSISFIGTIQLHFEIRKFKFVHNFIIIDSLDSIPGVDGILGVDFLKSWDFSWDLGKDTLIYKGNEIPLCTVQDDVIAHLSKTHDKIPQEGDFENRELTSFVSCIKKTITADPRASDYMPEDLVNQMDYFHFTAEPTDETTFESHFKIDHIPEHNREILLKILKQFKDVFLLPGSKLKGTNLIEHKIETGDAEPIFKRPYPVPHALRNELKDQISKMIEDGIIVPSTSNWCSPVLLVKKKSPDGTPKYRPVIDYRSLNAVTKKDRMPMNSIQEILDSLNGSTCFSVADAAYGFWQVPLHKAHQEKTAFATPFGLYECRVMPFGLTNSPATFVRLMHLALKDCINKICYVYMDDLIIFSDTPEEHLKRLEIVFEALRKAGLMLKPEKCHFMKESVEFLGHIISADGIQPCMNKIQAVSDFPRPQTVRDIRSFIGLCSYYRMFIKNFSRIALPLIRLTKKDVPFEWKEKEQKAFQELKDLLCSNTVLKHPDYEKPFLVSCDASGTDVSGILSQEENGFERPVAYASRQLNPAERNYSTIERELVAIIFAVRKFRNYIYNSKFLLITDHAPLLWLKNLKDPSSRLARFSLLLSEYDFEIKHKPGHLHTNADSLTRTRTPPNRLSQNQTVQDSDQEILASIAATIEPILDLKRIQIEQESDPEIKTLIDEVWAKENKHDNYYLDENTILRLQSRSTDKTDRIYIPKSLVDHVIKVNHDLPLSGHVGIQKTTETIASRYFWKTLRTDVRRYCTQCLPCAERKKSPHLRKAPLQQFTSLKYPNQITAMDIVGPLPLTEQGNKYMLTHVDLFSKWLEAYAIPDTKAETIAKVYVENIICRHGASEALLTDQGANLTGKVMQEVCQILRIKAIRTSPYHAQTDGCCERTHRTLFNILSHFVNQTSQDDWDSYLPLALFVMRTHKNISTNETPYFLTYGRDCLFPDDLVSQSPRFSYNENETYGEKLQRQLIEVFAEARKQLHKTAEQREKQYNKKTKPVTFKVGDQVLLHNPVFKKGLTPKLGYPWKGPYQIVDQTSPVNFKLQKPGTDKFSIVHANRLKLFQTTPEPDPALKSEPEPKPENVNVIRKSRKKGRRKRNKKKMIIDDDFGPSQLQLSHTADSKANPDLNVTPDKVLDPHLIQSQPVSSPSFSQLDSLSTGSVQLPGSTDKTILNSELNLQKAISPENSIIIDPLADTYTPVTRIEASPEFKQHITTKRSYPKFSTSFPWYSRQTELPKKEDSVLSSNDHAVPSVSKTDPLAQNLLEPKIFDLVTPPNVTPPHIPLSNPQNEHTPSSPLSDSFSPPFRDNPNDPDYEPNLSDLSSNSDGTSTADQDTFHSTTTNF